MEACYLFNRAGEIWGGVITFTPTKDGKIIIVVVVVVSFISNKTQQ